MSVSVVYQQRKNVTDTPPVGLEPTTFELEVQHASPLRHGGLTSTTSKTTPLLFCTNAPVIRRTRHMTFITQLRGALVDKVDKVLPFHLCDPGPISVVTFLPHPRPLFSILVPIVLTLKVIIQECRNIAMRDLYK